MFVIPTVISTIADIISIIDIVLKYGGFLSKDVKSAIEKSKTEIVSKKELSHQQASKILYNNLKVGVPESELSATTQSMENLFLLIDSLISDLQVYSKLNKIPKYGSVLFKAISNINDKIKYWGCYGKWAITLRQDLSETRHKLSTPFSLLNAPNLTRCFWENAELSSQIERRFKNLDLNFFKDNTSSRPFGSLLVTNKQYIRKSGFAPALDYMEITPAEHSIRFKMSTSWNSKAVDVDNSMFTTLISATFGDFYYYALKVNSELAESNILMEKLRNQKKTAYR